MKQKKQLKPRSFPLRLVRVQILEKFMLSRQYTPEKLYGCVPGAAFWMS